MLFICILHYINQNKTDNGKLKKKDQRIFRRL